MISPQENFCSLRIAEVEAMAELDTGLESTVTFQFVIYSKSSGRATASKLLEFA